MGPSVDPCGAIGAPELRMRNIRSHVACVLRSTAGMWGYCCCGGPLSDLHLDLQMPSIPLGRTIAADVELSQLHSDMKATFLNGRWDPAVTLQDAILQAMVSMPMCPGCWIWYSTLCVIGITSRWPAPPCRNHPAMQLTYATCHLQ